MRDARMQLHFPNRLKVKGICLGYLCLSVEGRDHIGCFLMCDFFVAGMFACTSR